MSNRQKEARSISPNFMMTSNAFGRLSASHRGTRSFYESLRAHDDGHLDEEAGLDLDEENLRQQFHGIDPGSLIAGESSITAESSSYGGRRQAAHAQRNSGDRREIAARWTSQEDDADNDVPESLLVEANAPPPPQNVPTSRTVRNGKGPAEPHHDASPVRNQGQWQKANLRSRSPPTEPRGRPSSVQPRSLMGGMVTGGRQEKALWRWVNTTNLDSFMRDVYDYYEGGGIWCILCANALWLLETLFVAVLLTFLSQCVDYSKLPHSRSLNQVVVPQCTRKMSGLWNLGIWLYTFFFIWKSVQYFFEIRRLVRIREFFVYLLEIPEQDMQTVSWQDIVARIMALRDQNPKTASNIPANLRRFMGSQSKERLDAHDIANRLMRKENYLIAMINKDLLNLSLPFPLLRGRQLFSKTMEWYLHYCILDMAFNELGQVQQDFLRADRRGLLSQKLKQRFYFAGILNLIFAPIVLAYVIIVYFFTYYNEYQKDPKLAAARKYTALAEWKFREFNELPHIFYERIHMSFPFATRYIDQFPKRMTEEIARSVAFVSGAITAILAVGTLLDSELFLGFEITEDRTVLFYLGVFGGIWALSRGMVSEESAVFNPEYALRSVAEYTHYMPDHWQGKLHSFEVKQEFENLYKMKVVIFLEEIMGILTTPMLLLLSLPKCSDQIIDFFREFTVHVDGLGYVCSFAVFDFKKGPENAGRQGRQRRQSQDVREDYYATKHGKMAASYYGFLDNYVINPKTGIPGHMPPAQHQFYPPPAFPSLNSPTLASDVQNSQFGGADAGRIRSRPAASSGGPSRKHPITLPSPMASMLLDPHHQPSASAVGTRSVHRSRPRRGAHRAEGLIPEETLDESLHPEGFDGDMAGSGGGLLEESTWETSPGKGLARENSAANTEEPETGVLGLIYQLRQKQHNRRGGVI